MARETDIYSLQEQGIELECTDEEIKRYIVILLYLAVYKLPLLRMAWSKDLKLNEITHSKNKTML